MNWRQVFLQRLQGHSSPSQIGALFPDRGKRWRLRVLPAAQELSCIQAKVYSGYRVNLNGTLTIGALAKRTGVKVVTIRYYEQVGLLPRCGRTIGNYRVYSTEHLERLHFVRKCRALGFSLDQIRDLLLLSSSNASTCAEVCNAAAEHLKEIEAKIADLKRLATELRRIGASCNGRRAITECRIIAALTES